MAESMIAGLFGLTPEMYQRQQYQQDLKTGAELAQLSPGAAAQAELRSNVGQLGRGFAGLMGVEDPQMKLISARQQILGQLDQTNPESMLQGIRMLGQMGDQQGAMALAEYYRKAEGEIAQTKARLAQATRERQQSVPNQIQIAQSLSQYNLALDKLNAMEPSPDRDEAIRTVSRTIKAIESQIEKPEKITKTNYGPEADRAAKGKFGKNFDELTQAEAAEIDKLLEERGVKKAEKGASKLVLPGEKALVDIPTFTRNVQQTIEKPLNAIYQVDNALANIQEAIKTDNFASYRAAQTQFAKAIAGAGDLSQKELKAAGADPAFVGGTADYLSTLATSTPTKDTMEKMQKAMQTIKKVNTNKANSELNRQRKIAIAAGYPTDAVEMALSFPELSTAPESGEKKANTRTLKSGKVVTVIEE